jgi:hypothetical protein
MDDNKPDPDDRGYVRCAPARPRDGRTLSTDSARGGRAIWSVGGRVYDSEKGVTCHWCRQKTVETHVTCVGEACSGARLPVAFCTMCLRNRHGEDIDAAVASGCWTCPRCRGSCGKGCVTCCNCGPCRKKAGLSPTHQIIGIARANGFDNVHDYLVHQKTGESAAVISARKTAFPWGAWLRDDFCPPVDVAAASDASDEEDEEEANASSDEEQRVDDDDDDVLSASENDEMDSDVSDDDDFMIVQRTPKKRPAASAPSGATSPHTPAKSPRKRAAQSPSSHSPPKRTKRPSSVNQTAATKQLFPSSTKKTAGVQPLAEVDSDDNTVIGPIMGDDVYEFEAILARRKRGRGEQLLIKWRGFDESQATWEPASNIIGAV